MTPPPAATILLALAGLMGLPAAARAAQPASPCAGGCAPVCASASHSRLLVQPGRDVCAPTLANGAPVAVGFLPTSCPPVAPVLIVDAKGTADLCLPQPAAAPPRPGGG